MQTVFGFTNYADWILQLFVAMDILVILTLQPVTNKNKFDQLIQLILY